MTHPSPSSSNTKPTRRRWWIAPSVLVLGLYAGFFAFAVAQACPNRDVTPYVDCVVNNNNGTYTAWFGYTNTGADVKVALDTYKPTQYNQVIDPTTKAQLPMSKVFVPPPNLASSFEFYANSTHNYKGDYVLSATFSNPKGVTWDVAEGSVTALPNAGTCADGISVSPSPATSTLGQPITFTAPVTVKAIVPKGVNPPPFTGSVLFTDENNHPLGPAVPLTSNDIETITTSSLSVGPHTITATYSGNSVYPLVSATTTVQVNPLTATCGISVSTGSSSVVNQPVTFTALFKTTATMSQQVTFSDSLNGGASSPLGTSGVTNHTATLITSKLGLGNHVITANYTGDPALSIPACQAPLSVTKVPTATTVTSSVNPSVAGQPVTFTATVAPVTPNACTPTGTVSFTIDGAAVTNGTVTVNGSGQASLPPNPSLAIGTHDVKAVYNGDSICDTSNNSLTQTVGNVPPPPSGGTNAYIRIAQSANLASNPIIDVAIDSQTSFPGLKACTVNPYAPLSAGNHTVSASLNGSLLKSLPITFTAGDYYTVAIVDDPTASPAVAPNLVVFQDDLSVTPGQAKVRVYHLNDSAGPISVTANGTVEVTSLSFENASSYFNQNPGVENYTITLLNHPTTQLNDSLNEAANQVYGIFVMNNCVTNTTTGGIPTALPQTGFAPVSYIDWNAIAFLMGALAIGGAAVGGVSGLAVVQYRRRRR